HRRGTRHLRGTDRRRTGLARSRPGPAAGPALLPGLMHPALLLLTDSRLPAGGHAHSGGVEQAVALGLVHDLPSLSAFLHGRLRTAGALAAALAASACAFASVREENGRAEDGPSWEPLDAEADARTASPAQREAARTQGKLPLRVTRRLGTAQGLDGLAEGVPGPNRPVPPGAAAPP